MVTINYLENPAANGARSCREAVTRMSGRAYEYTGKKKAQALFDISPAANRTTRSRARITQTSTSCRCEGYAG